MVKRLDVVVGLLELGEYLPNALKLGQRVVPVERQQLFDLRAHQSAPLQRVFENKIRQRPLIMSTSV